MPKVISEEILVFYAPNFREVDGAYWFWGERGGSVVECRTPEREVRGSRPTAAVLCPWARHFTPRKYWLITQEAMAPSRHDWKIVDWDVKPQHNNNILVLGCPSIHVCVHARVLKFHIWIPHGKIVNTCFFSFPSYLPFWVMPLSYESCMLGFWDFIYEFLMEIFFSCPSCLPFWSYAPLKTSEWNLVCKISRKVFELGAWNLVSW